MSTARRFVAEQIIGKLRVPKHETLPDVPTVAEVLRRQGGEYLDRFGSRMPPLHHQVLGAIRACRTGALGKVRYTCTACGGSHVMGRSCGNRHCPTCQREKTRAWLEKHSARLLPCPYFLLTFTLPSELRCLARGNTNAVYNVIFQASRQAIRALAAGRRFFGTAQPGFFGVLHTWDRTLGYHPHVHYIVSGGAVGAGRTSLNHLATYVFRVAISDHRIVTCDDHKVTFSYRRSGTNRWRRMTLDAMEFIRRFLQHVLPRGFQKVRHCGFPGTHAPLSIEAVRWLVTLNNGAKYVLLAATPVDATLRPTRRCAECGGQLRVVAIFPKLASTIHDTS